MAEEEKRLEGLSPREQEEARRMNAVRIEAAHLTAKRLQEEARIASLREAEFLDFMRLESERLRALADRREREAAALSAHVMGARSEAPALAVRLPDEPDPDAPLDVAGIDEELLDIFLEEGQDLLDHCDGLLVKLRADTADRETIAALQRDLHTLKGGARTAGVMIMGELAHAIETLLEAATEGKVSLGQAEAGLIEQGMDRLNTMLGRVAARRAIAPAERLVAQLVACAEGRGLAAPLEQADVQRALAGQLTSLDQEIEPLTRPSQEMVRVRAELLDRLVNYAGEVAIYRARLEQQLGAFRGAMVEMEQTNARLRDQLRRLEIETEVQIIARYQREEDIGQEGFDPLELDRFSTLQQLSRALGESANDLSSLQVSLEDLTRQYETLLTQQSRVSTELQEGLMRTRMVPLESILPRLRRVVRQAASDSGKQVELLADGSHGELDRNVLEHMVAPLEHLLRNAVGHGIETPAQRQAAGKPATGEVRLKMRQEGSEVVLDVSDDGAGINRQAVRERALARGIIRAEDVLADTQIDQLILMPGFTTADEVSLLSGRGVGMDVVSNEVRQIGGSLEIISIPERGSRFTLRLPQRMAVTQAVFVRIGERVFAVPVASVRGVSRMPREEYHEANSIHSYGGEEYEVHDMGLLLGQAPAKAEGQLQMPLLLVRAGDLRVAVGVDQILGNREIVVKPTGPQVASVPGIFGATVMGDGQIMIILDIAPLARHYISRKAQSNLPDGSAEPAVERVPLVMVVDDSITMRKVSSRVLARQGLEVITAKDGIDALEQMEDRVPDLMLLDIEMPRMDGYELAAEMRRQVRLRQVPIVMITSRSGDKHRQRAFDLGVNRYLGKPYQEPELLRHVNELLGRQA